MDAVGIAERTRPPVAAEANARAPEPDHFKDPAMTRAAREERAARRRAAPEAWRLELRDLYHCTADYPYEPDHEYAGSWTTAPDYGTDSVRLFRFDADGVMDRADNRARDMQRTAFHTSVAQLGDGVVRTTPSTTGPRAGMPGMATGRERTLRLDRGHPPPALTLEILSFGGTQRDLEHRRLYAELGIREYLVHDLGGQRRRGSPRELPMFRPENGADRQAKPEPKASDADPDEFWSDVFGACIRMMPDPREAFSDKPAELGPPRFQWWNPERDRWRDTETDAEVEQGRILRENDRIVLERNQVAQERTDIAVAMMRNLPSRELTPTDRDKIEDAWRRDDPPPGAADRILKVRDAPNEWQSLLLPGQATTRTATTRQPATPVPNSEVASSPNQPDTGGKARYHC